MEQIGLHAETVLGEEVCTPALISRELHTEWKTFRNFLAKKPKSDMKTQLKVGYQRSVFLFLLVATASVERSFSQMKMIKTRLRNRIGESSLSSLMRIAIESPEKLSDNDLENIVDIWNRKPRRIAV